MKIISFVGNAHEIESQLNKRLEKLGDIEIIHFAQSIDHCSTGKTDETGMPLILPLAVVTILYSTRRSKKERS